MINRQKKFVLIHIPKTAGTAIERVFEPDAHETMIQYKHHSIKRLIEIDPILSEYYKFTVVRNPWDIVLSLYTYMWKSEYPWPLKWRNSAHFQSPEFLSLSFDGWVKHPSFKTSSLRSAELLNKNNSMRDVLQSDWLIDYSGKIQMDYICKFESLQKDFDQVCMNLELEPTKLTHVFRSKEAGYRKYYSDETRKIVESKYAIDIEYFKYSF